MNVSIIGTGKMARGIGTRLVAGGNSVTLIGRSSEKAGDLAAELRSAATAGATVKTAAIGKGITDEVVVLAVPYPAEISVVKEYGTKLGGKILVSLTTAFNPTFDGLATAADTSTAEEVAKAAPAGARVIKAFNTNFSGTLVAGQVAGQPLDVFIAGDDVPAKAIIAGLVESGGLRPLDVGPLQRARQLEGLHFLSASLQSKLNKPWMTSIKFVS